MVLSQIRQAIEALGFPIFCRGVSAILAKRSGIEEGAVNVPIEIGGITVNPGDLIVADEDGVIVASVEVAGEQLAACLELEEWEAYALGQIKSGRPTPEVLKERRTYPRDGG